jgi:hypothetical protein
MRRARERSPAVEVDRRRPVIRDRHRLGLDGTAALAMVVGQGVVELAVWGFGGKRWRHGQAHAVR